jgi:hypothetical protein
VSRRLILRPDDSSDDLCPWLKAGKQHFLNPYADEDSIYDWLGSGETADQRDDLSATGSDLTA